MPPDQKVRTPARESGHPYYGVPYSGEQDTVHSPGPAMDDAQLERGGRLNGRSWSEGGGQQQWPALQRPVPNGLPALPSIHDFLAQQGPVEGAPRADYWQPPHASAREQLFSPAFEAPRPQQHHGQYTSAPYDPGSHEHGLVQAARMPQDLREGQEAESRGYGGVYGGGWGGEGYAPEHHYRFTPSYPSPSVPQLYRPDYASHQSTIFPSPSSHAFHPSPHDYSPPDRSYFGHPFRRSSAPELSFATSEHHTFSPQSSGAYRSPLYQHTTPSSNHSASYHADDSPLSSPHADSPLASSSSRNLFPYSPPPNSSRRSIDSDFINAVLVDLFHRADKFPPFAPELLVVVWDGTTSRALAYDSPEARSLEPHPENELIVFGNGGWVPVLDKHGYEAFPWSAGKAANDWLRLQAEYCLCKRFKFWQGPKKVTKHPSVIRDHISHCAGRDEHDPLARLCRLERTTEKRAKAAKVEREERRRDPALVSFSTVKSRTPSDL